MDELHVKKKKPGVIRPNNFRSDYSKMKKLETIQRKKESDFFFECVRIHGISTCYP
jgi:hypothetical protein